MLSHWQKPLTHLTTPTKITKTPTTQPRYGFAGTGMPTPAYGSCSVAGPDGRHVREMPPRGTPAPDLADTAAEKARGCTLNARDMYAINDE